MSEKEKIKKLDGNFKKTENWRDVAYVLHPNGDVELCWEYDSAYPILSAEEILKLAEIVKEREEKTEMSKEEFEYAVMKNEEMVEDLEG